MEVFYTGLHKSVEQIIATAKKEGVNVIGLSILSGTHLSLTQKLVEVPGVGHDGDKMFTSPEGEKVLFAQ